ncbi:GGDEF domain-containing protein [Deinococcus aquaticus]|uniref:GGDEF domain-containing protein n=1 Tax=Deinococcus aquaticus TaxID=328692 RepID=A0ABY7V4Q1_9DEIO|nr:GGDEF domain-containing protein [Deinococcus aquaticus]WDA59078.1 GGDEF domain-containing protein [Deinococcus aquaticus]
MRRPPLSPRDSLTASQVGGVARDSLDRRALNRRLLGVVLAALLLKMLSLPMSSFERAALPLLALLMAGVAASTHNARVPLRTLHLTTLLGAWAYLLGSLWFVLFRVPSELQLVNLSGMGPWITVLIASHLWLLGRQDSRLLNLLGLGGVAGLTLVYVAGHGAWASPIVGMVVQTLLASTILLVGQHSAVLRTLGNLRRDLLGGGLPGEHDPLTGLPGRQGTEDALVREFQRRPEGLSVAVIGVDGLGALQEQYGLGFTERLVAHLSRVTLGVVRDQDVLGRLGADQLVMVMRTPDARAARAACERLRVRIASRPLEGVNLTVSVGVAFYAEHADPQALWQEAQDALASVQGSSQNRVALGVWHAAGADDRPDQNGSAPQVFPA